uniref:Thiol:disulfi de interchange protein n=1 Tax=Trichogloeopsis pedicellata TaxID=1495610 RepID=A0A1G4P084_9FLOR|nr:Thiol:disulfi de interchange protein [Trichogloeopsis pedicellata]SCW24315.1 Thiol:disulfi de interchange protein [Trichogloeopsis pedicellata]
MNTSILNFNLYTIQQYINQILVSQLSTISLVSLITTFTGGVFTSISPCVISSIPFAVLYINRTHHKTPETLTLITGICSSLFTIGLITLTLKKYSWIILGTTPFFWPLVVIILGLSLLEIIPITKNIETMNLTYNQAKKQFSFIQTYAIGVSLGITISPCSTPITITIFGWISTTQQYITGLILLLVYVLGYITPILISILSFNNFNILNLLSKNSYIIMNVLGSITITSGSYSLFKEVLRLI